LPLRGWGKQLKLTSGLSPLGLLSLEVKEQSLLEGRQKKEMVWRTEATEKKRKKEEKGVKAGR
jgi:hypothetical protein